MDIVDKKTRSRNMSRIRSKDTKPEKLVRSILHKHGYRFRLHVKDLPGKPDIVLPKYRLVIFVHGCFWHMHGCKNSKIPETRHDWWKEKLESNERRDEQHYKELEELGWKVMVVWECEFRRLSHAKMLVKSAAYIRQVNKITAWAATDFLGH